MSNLAPAVVPSKAEVDAFLKSLDSDKSDLRAIDDLLRVRGRVVRLQEAKVEAAHQLVKAATQELREVNSMEEQIKKVVGR